MIPELGGDPRFGVGGGVDGRLSRRRFIEGTILLTAGAALARRAEAKPADGLAEADPAFRGVVDVSVSLSRWPFRRLPLDETRLLVAKLKGQGVTQAWAGSFDAVLHKNPGAANERLAEECRRYRGFLVPFGAVNPLLSGWEEDLRRCQEQFKMPGVRVHPNYHGYRLADPAGERLVNACAERGLILQIAVMMEDERTQHPLARVPHVDVEPLAALLKARPGLRVILLNWARGVKPALAAQLARTGRVWLDISSVEGVGGLASLLESVPREQVLFGSHAPFYYFESAKLKLRESGLGGPARECIQARNAAGLRPRS